MASGIFGSRLVRPLGRWALALALAGWCGADAAVPMQTEGALRVGPDGTADYSLAIAVPPGTAGMAPALSLNYSSGAGDGILGIGWSLGGLPSITRCPQTVAQDGQSMGVTFSSTDRFCYGGQRLVAVSGEYGASGTVYRTEIDQFSQITSFGSQGSGPAYFVVQTKSGQTQYFGGHPSTVIGGTNAQVLATGTQTARAWPLDSVYDQLTNYYTVQYSAEDSTTGETHPLSIQYTGNQTNGLTWYNSVKFGYGPLPGANGATPSNSRLHPLIAHLAGTTSTTSVLLTSIQSFSAGGALVHNYELNYRTGGTGRPQIASIDHCDSGGNCLPATTFTWSATTINTTASQPLTCQGTNGGAPTNGGVNNAQPYIVDLNNDGRDDILWVKLVRSLGEPGNEVSPVLRTSPAVVGVASGIYEIWYSNGDGSFNCTPASFSTPGPPSSPSFGGTPLFGDFGGTGRTDILLEGNVSTQDGWDLEVNVDDAGTFALYKNPIKTTWNPGTNFVATQVAIGDFEGLGRSSIVAFQNNPGIGAGWAYWTNSGGYSFQIHQSSTNGPSPPNGLTPGIAANINPGDFAAYAADFNGDGKADILFDSVDQNFGQSTGADREIALSNGDGTFTLEPLDLGSLSIGPAVVTIGDFNGDGVADLIFNPLVSGTTTGATTGQLVVLLGNGDGTFTQVPASQLGALATGAFAGYQVLAGNFSGTGLTDLLLDQESPPGDSSGTYALFTSNGDGTFTEQGGATTTSSFASGARPLMGDFGGVGHDSLLWDQLDSSSSPPGPGSTGTDALLLTNQVQPLQPDLITLVTGGLGATAAITYTPLSTSLSQNGVYTKDAYTATSYPTVALQTAQPVVSTVETVDGIGGERLSNFTYGSLRADLWGRGILGFGTVIAADQASGITTTTSYNQVFPEIGTASGSTTTVQNVTAPVNTTTITYDIVPEVPGTAVPGVPGAAVAGTPSVTFVGSYQITVARNDLDGTQFPTATTTLGYDCDTSPQSCFGNVKTETVSPDPGDSTATALGYQAADTDTWLVGEVSAVMVTDTVNGTSLSRSASFGYSSTGLLLSSTIEPGNGGGALTSTNAAGQVSDLTLPATYSYDGFGNPIAMTLNPTDEPARTTTASWVTSPLNLNSGQQYNQFPQSITNALGYTAHFGYDPRFGTVGIAADINNLVTFYTYDTFGRLIQTLGPDQRGVQFVYAYCSRPNVTPPANATIEPNCPALGAYAVTATPVSLTPNRSVIGPVTTSVYDLFGRVIETDTTAFDGTHVSRVQSQYNTLGQLVLKTEPALVSGPPPSCTAGSCSLPAPTAVSAVSTSWTYDALGRVSQTTAPDGGVVRHGYSGLVQTDTLPTGPFASPATEVFTTTRNARGQTVSVVDAIGNRTSYSYFPFGSLASVTDQAGNSVAYSYDPLGRLNGVIDPDAGPRFASYFSTGELASVTEPGNSSSDPPLGASFAYDELGRMTSRIEPDLTSNWFYDQNNDLGKLTTATTSAGTGANYAGYPGGCTYGYGYDSLMRLSTTTLVIGNVAPIGFKDAYVPVKSPNPGNPTSPPGAGQLANVTDNNSGSVTNYSYTAQGFFTQMSRGPKANPTANSIYSIAAADASLRPTAVKYGTASFTNNAPASNVTDTYQYDLVNELLQADNAATFKTFTYDPQGTGNLAAKSDTGTYNYGPGPHQLQSITPIAGASEPITASYTYDARGNMVAGEDGAGYSWTSFNQPQTITKDGAQVQYFYDMNHTRIAVRTTSGASTTPVTKLYLHDGSGAFAEADIDQNGNILGMLDYFSAGGTALGMLTTPFTLDQATGATQPGAPSMLYFHTDRRGSIVAMSDDTGMVASGNFYSFDPWGKRRTVTSGADDPGDTITSPAAYGYIDEEQIAGVTDLVNLNARLYNSHTGRFISPDPIGLAGGRNVYAYSGNNPTTMSDRSGLDYVVTSGGPGCNGSGTGICFSTTVPGDPPLIGGPGGSSASTPAETVPAASTENAPVSGNGQQPANSQQQGNDDSSSSAISCFNCSLVTDPFITGDVHTVGFSGVWGANPGTNTFLAALNSLPNRFLAPGAASALMPKAAPGSGPSAAGEATPGVSPDNGANSLVTTFVPGAQFAQQAQADFRDGDFGLGIVAAVASLADAALGAVTFGESTEIQAGIRAATKATTSGLNVVYRSITGAGVTQYVGITNNLARRAAEQLASRGIQIEKLLGGLSREDARAVEQTLIELNGLGKNGGTLLNRINSIAASNPTYAQQLQRGQQLLQSIGF